jgi:hypothetical protein
VSLVRWNGGTDYVSIPDVATFNKALQTTVNGIAYYHDTSSYVQEHDSMTMQVDEGFIVLWSHRCATPSSCFVLAVPLVGHDANGQRLVLAEHGWVLRAVTGALAATLWVINQAIVERAICDWEMIHNGQLHFSLPVKADKLLYGANIVRDTIGRTPLCFLSCP